jgi:hypothetical protein
MATAIKRLQYVDSKQSALRRLREVADLDAEDCLASHAVSIEDSDLCRANPRVRFAEPDLVAVMTRYSPWNSLETVMTASGALLDQRPC